MHLTSSISSFSSGPSTNNWRAGGFHLSCTEDFSGSKEMEGPCHSRHFSRILRWPWTVTYSPLIKHLLPLKLFICSKPAVSPFSLTSIPFLGRNRSRKTECVGEERCCSKVDPQRWPPRSPLRGRLKEKMTAKMTVQTRRGQAPLLATSNWSSCRPTNPTIGLGKAWW